MVSYVVKSTLTLREIKQRHPLVILESSLKIKTKIIVDLFFERITEYII